MTMLEYNKQLQERVLRHQAAMGITHTIFRMTLASLLKRDREGRDPPVPSLARVPSLERGIDHGR